MSEFTMKCPHCEVELRVDSSWDGQVVECPNCKREFCIEVPGQTMQRPRSQIVQPQYGQPQQSYAQSQYGPPPVPPQKNNVLKWVLIGCGSCVLFVVLIVIVLALLSISATSSAKEKARRISCNSNMKQIMLSIRMYSGDFNEKFPSGRSSDFRKYSWAASLPAPLDLLVTQIYLTDQKTFECPSNPGKCSYLMVGSGFSEDDNSDIPVLFELPSNHKGGYINVGYVDGSVLSVILPQDCKTAEQVAEFLLKKVDISSAKREMFMRNVREAERQLNR